MFLVNSLFHSPFWPFNLKMEVQVEIVEIRSSFWRTFRRLRTSQKIVFAACWSLYTVRKRQSPFCSPMTNFCFHQFYFQKTYRQSSSWKNFWRNISNAYSVNMRGNLDISLSIIWQKNLQKKHLPLVVQIPASKGISEYSVISFCLSFYTYLMKLYWFL